SHYRSIRNRSILRHNDDPIADVVAAVWSIDVFHAGFIQQSHLGPDAGVLIDNRAANNRALTDADPRPAFRAIVLHVFQGLIVIRAHHVGRVELHALAQTAAQTDQ